MQRHTLASTVFTLSIEHSVIRKSSRKIQFNSEYGVNEGILQRLGSVKMARKGQADLNATALMIQLRVFLIVDWMSKNLVLRNTTFKWFVYIQQINLQIQCIGTYFAPTYFPIDPYFARFWKILKCKIRVDAMKCDSNIFFDFVWSLTDLLAEFSQS